jgi:ribosomal protein S27E
MIGDEPVFDAEEAKGLDEYKVRERFPRTYQSCIACGTQTICYASAEHYVAGDW